MAPSLEEVKVMVSKVLDEGHKLKFVELNEIPDDKYIFSACGVHEEGTRKDENLVTITIAILNF